MLPRVFVLGALTLVPVQMPPANWKQQLAAARGAIEATRLDEAEKLLDEARRTAGEKAARLVGVYRDIGRAYQQQMRYTDAERVYRAALEIREQAGAQQPAVASSLADLASAVGAQHRLTEAGALLERALAIVEKTHGVSHPAWGYRAGGLADALAEQGKLEAAGQTYQKALKSLAASLGPETVPVADVLDRYASLLAQAGKPEAQQMRSQAAAIRAAKSVKGNRAVTPPRLVLKSEPEYTLQARAAEFEGTVVLYLEVDTAGVPRQIRVLVPLGMGLDEEAVKAVERWRFQPATRDGRAITVSANIEMNFRLL